MRCWRTSAARFRPGLNLIGDNGDVLGAAGKSVSHAVVAGIAAEIRRSDGKGAAAGALAAELAGVVMQSTLFEPANLNEKERQLYRLQEALNGNEVKEQTARVIGAFDRGVDNAYAGRRLQCCGQRAVGLSLQHDRTYVDAVCAG